MKILVFAHRLEVGGTQVNAIELAAALRDLHGHEVMFFATPGPLVRMVEQKNLRYLPAPDARIHPAPRRMLALREVVRQERPALIYAWDWWQCLDAYYAVHLPMRVPMVVTDMMMNLTRVLPKQLPTTFGTPEIFERAQASGRRFVELIMPPVDVDTNAPGAADASSFRERHGLEPGDITIVTVSRLANWMKAESIVRTIDAVGRIHRDLPVRLVIVGDGAARRSLEELANRINAEAKRPAIIFTGELVNPRPAYAAADIVVGMGGSSLRGMAFAKPVIIVGEFGFSAPLTPETAESFLYRGMYGRGSGDAGNAGLVGHITRLAHDADARRALGDFSREFVVKHFALTVMSSRLAAFCRRAASETAPLHVAVADCVRTAGVYLRDRRFLVPSRSLVTESEITGERVA